MEATEVQLLQQKAQNGDPAAQLTLGARLLVGRDAPHAPARGAALVAQAAAAGVAEAALLAAALAVRAQRMADGVRLLGDAARDGHPGALGQYELLGGDRIDLDYWTKTPASVDWAHDAPRVGVIESLLEPRVCAWLVEQARPKLRRVRVNDPSTGDKRADEYRSNSGAGFSILDANVVVELTRARIAAAIGVASAQLEPTNILHYAPGQEYKPHFDFVDPKAPRFLPELHYVGQRIATALIYLNHEYEGGETQFPRLDWRYKGKAGDALVFWNVSREGAMERNSLHAGLPVSQGEKWLFSQWVRAKAFPLI